MFSQTHQQQQLACCTWQCQVDGIVTHFVTRFVKTSLERRGLQGTLQLL